MMDGRLNILISRPHAKLECISNVLPLNRFNVHACPTIDVRTVVKEAWLDDLLSQINNFDYLVFTSQYAVIEIFERLKSIGVEPKALNAIKICAVGPMVSQALNKFGFVAQLVPQKYTAQSLADLFPSVRHKMSRILLPRGNRSPQVLKGVLSEKGYEVISPIVYTTDLRETLDEQIQTMIVSRKVDCFAFTSPSSVVALAAILKRSFEDNILRNVVISAIGPSTYKACTDAGFGVDILPNEHTVQGMARAITHFFSKTASRHQ